MKTCTKCGESKATSEFQKRSNGAAGLQAWCKACRNADHRRWKSERTPEQVAKDERNKRNRYLIKMCGITIEQYEEMLEAQDGVCFICRNAPASEYRTLLDADHCHTHGKMRALLCHHCNCAIGNAHDIPARLRAMADYIEWHCSNHEEHRDPRDDRRQTRHNTRRG